MNNINRWMNKHGFVKVREARYGWTAVTCPQTNLEKRIITCINYEKKMIDGELHNIENSVENCSDDCDNINCKYRKNVFTKS